MARQFARIFMAVSLLIILLASTTWAGTKVSFPFTPISAASLPWWIAKESRFYEKFGLDVDMIYVGASPVIVQAMLGGQAGVGAGGGPPLVANILQGGDVVEVATTVPARNSIAYRKARDPHARRFAWKKNRYQPFGSDSPLHSAGDC